MNENFNGKFSQTKIGWMNLCSFASIFNLFNGHTWEKRNNIILIHVEAQVSIDDTHTHGYTYSIHIHSTNLWMWFVYKSPKPCANETKKKRKYRSDENPYHFQSLQQHRKTVNRKKYIVIVKQWKERERARESESDKKATSRNLVFSLFFSQETCILQYFFFAFARCSYSLVASFVRRLATFCRVYGEFYILKNDLTDSKQITCMNETKLNLRSKTNGNEKK